MTLTGPPATELQPVQFSRLTHRGILLGQSATQLVVLALAAAALIAGFTVGGAGLAWATPFAAACCAVAWVKVGGRTVVDWAPIGFGWARRSVAGQLVFHHDVSRLRPAGTLALPGDAARLRQFVDPGTGAAYVHDPHANTLTAILGIEHPSFVLLDPAQQQRRTTGWGRVLATACRSGRIAALQLCERTLPDSGKGLTAWWAQHGRADGTWPASMYADLVAHAGPAGERHATTISLSLDLKAAARTIRAAGGGMRGSAAVLRQEIETLTAALRSADLPPTAPLDPADLALVLRSAYDPAVAAALERHGSLGRDLASAGPVSVAESWGSLQSDSAHHAVLWISEWPRTQVYPGFLAPLLLGSGVRRAFTMLFTPVRADVAARDLRRKKTEYISDAAQRAKIGQIEDAGQSAENTDVLQQEADLTAGHGVLRATGLVSIGAPDVEELERAVAVVEQAAIQSSCETRRLWGQQAQAFVAAALPLCRTA
ncbi:SCO6880 family protein [Xylanimonas ulmi]|uniref:Type VII secretion system protein EccE domain-containing protein n=1 Tax=Xylanimonas ulmi TaxID=228973 RepID=A0A4V2EXU0_9MICO|nr:SCO6880 family protein [Xylanibacterium ulmi]RZS60660.1 hypothetical protein EV386_0932 [Xylanibacterium ulmi]